MKYQIFVKYHEKGYPIGEVYAAPVRALEPV
jgi:hypothetical protein